jgi:hypothetical protein
MNIEPNQPSPNVYTTEMEAEGCEAVLVNRYRERYAADHPNMIEYLKKHLFFNTITFNRQNISLPNYSDLKPTPIGAYRQLSHRVLRKIMGNNIRRKRDYQPLQLGWIDFDGSRNASRIQPSLSLNPHLHILTLVSPEHRLPFWFGIKDWVTRAQLTYESAEYKHHEVDEFLATMKWDRDRKGRKPHTHDWLSRVKTCGVINDMELRCFDPAKLPLRELAGYCMKGWKKLDENIRDDYCFDLPPERNNGTPHKWRTKRDAMAQQECTDHQPLTV